MNCVHEHGVDSVTAGCYVGKGKGGGEGGGDGGSRTSGAGQVTEMPVVAACRATSSMRWASRGPRERHAAASTTCARVACTRDKKA